VFLSLWVTQVVVLTILDVVALATHQVLDHSAQHRADMALIAVSNTLAVLVAMDLVVTSTSMVVEVTDTDLTMHMVTTQQVHPLWVALNHHHTTSQIILTDTNPTRRGVLAVTEQETLTVAQEVERVSL